MDTKYITTRLILLVFIFLTSHNLQNLNNGNQQSFSAPIFNIYLDEIP
jgi:hypothetical protein